MACETCISALTIKKENNAFKNQNEGTEIRNLKWSHMATMDVISDAFLNHWNLNFLNCSNSRTPPGILKTSACNCQLQPYGQRSSLVSVQPFGIPANPYLISTLIFCKIQLWFLTSKSYNLAVFAFISLSRFCSPAEYNSSASWICVSWAIVLRLAQLELSSVPLTDWLLIIS